MSDSWEYFDRPATAVEANLSVMNARADEALAVANAAIASLSNLGLGAPANPPQLTLESIDIPPPVEPVGPTERNFGTLYNPTDPVFEDLYALIGVSLNDLLLDIDPFVSTVGAIQMPPTPAPIDSSGQPTKPALDDVVIPESPDLVLPTLANLTELVIPEFTFPDLPTFDDEAPEFTEARPSTSLSWLEPEYSSDVLTDVQARVRAMLAGGTGLPLHVQNALFDRARGSEVLTALEAEQKAFDTFAARGYSMPPGMLVEQVNQAREKSRSAQNTLNREILVESAKWEIENLRFAVEKGISLETVLIQQFMDMAKRSFEAAKFQVESEISVFNAMVAVYNARQQGYRTAAEVFKIRVDAELAELEVFKAQIQGEIAKGQLNEQKVREYEARLKGTMAFLDIYKTKMEGAKIQSDVVRNQIEGYKADIEAYGARLDAEKKRFDAYEAQVRAESAKAGALEAEARAYAATVSAQEAQGNLKMKWVDGKIASLRASTEKYLAQVESQKSQVTASAAEIEARAKSYSVDIERYTAEIQGSTAAVQSAVQVAEARLRNLVAYYEAQMGEYNAITTRIVEEAKIVLGGLEAAARNSAALAQGAMAAISVRASMQGSGQVSDHQSYNVNINRKGADVA